MSKTSQQHFNTKMNYVHHNSVKSENYSNVGRLINTAILGYYADVVAKSTAERQNSNDLHMANSSTPLNRAFFVRSSRTPQERPETLRGSERHSMVACNGKGSPFAVFHMSQFLTPLHAIAQIVRSLAIAPKKSHMELSTMIYKFLLTGSKRLRITIHANSKAEALSRVHFTTKPLLVARLRNELVKNSVNMTACDTEQNHRLPSVGGCGYDDFTTKTKDGHRSRYSSGIFLPQIYQNHGISTAVIHSEFAVRATPRTKADCIRTNKGGCSLAVVEPLSHLISDKPLSLTRTKDTMNKPTQTPNGRNANATPIVISSRIEGVQYA